MVSQSIRVNFIPSGVQDRLHASQYDTGERVFSFLCFYGSSLYEIPSGAVVTLNGQKPGGYTFVIPCTYDGSTVTCDCTASMTDVDGLVTCELEVVTNGEVVQSGNFYLVVEKAAIDSGAVPTSDFEAVSQMVADAAASAQAAEEAAASIDPSTFVQKSEITRSTTQTTTGQKVVDAVELNPNVSGTLAKKISDNASAISTLNTDAIKKADLSSSGTVTTQNQYAADAWQLNPDNTGSYAAGVASEIASLTNNLTTKKTYTLESNNANVTITQQQCYSIGNVCSFTLVVTVSAEVPTYTHFIKGFPNNAGAYMRYPVYQSNALLTGFHACIGNNSRTMSCYGALTEGSRFISGTFLIDPSA